MTIVMGNNVALRPIVRGRVIVIGSIWQLELVEDDL